MAKGPCDIRHPGEEEESAVTVNYAGSTMRNIKSGVVIDGYK